MNLSIMLLRIPDVHHFAGSLNFRLSLCSFNCIFMPFFQGGIPKPKTKNKRGFMMFLRYFDCFSSFA